MTTKIRTKNFYTVDKENNNASEDLTLAKRFLLGELPNSDIPSLKEINNIVDNKGIYIRAEAEIQAENKKYLVRTKTQVKRLINCLMINGQITENQTIIKKQKFDYIEIDENGKVRHLKKLSINLASVLEVA